MISTNRRRLIAGAACSVAAVGFGPRRLHAQAAPIRIGCMTTLSGVYSLAGLAQSQGMQIAAEAINAAGGINGRPLEIVVRDDGSKPDAALASVRELAGDGVRLFAGVLASPVALAISGVMKELDSVFVNAASHGNNLTHEDFNRHYFRVTDYSAMRIGAAARLMAERYPTVRTWGLLLPDVEIGRSILETFRYRLPDAHRVLHKAEVTIKEPVWVKFGTTDYRNAIAALLSQGIDGLFVGNGGGDEIAFMQQAGQFGLTAKVKAITNSGSELQVAQALKNRTPDNYWTGCHWYHGAYPDNELAKQLVKVYVDKGYGAFPDGFVGAGHTAVMAIAAALKKGAAPKSDEMIPALEGLVFQSVKGPIEIRKEDHQALCDVNYANPVASSSAQGWEVKDFARVDARALAGPPQPGQKIRFE